MLDYVDLENLNFSLFDNDANRLQLATRLLQGASSQGFFTISNHGIPEDLYTSQVDLAYALLTIPLEEKLSHETTPEDDARCHCVGFKPTGGQKHKKGFQKTLDYYTILANKPNSYEHPSILYPHRVPTIELIRHFRNQLLPNS
ncbi:clavaminate synthase-like protein [Colletotrichum incanum]|nr:clavaminate synthase-like protein [Colletotrichum incanum]